MIPKRFVVEYPQRCVKMLEMLEPAARKEQLLGSFSLLVASSLFLIPYERMKKAHPLNSRQDEPKLYDAIRKLEKRPFNSNDMWADYAPKNWRFSRIITSPDHTENWLDENECHPMHGAAINTIDNRKIGEVLRVVRNALAHGNVVYLDEHGYERHGEVVQYLAFLSRYEENEEQRNKSETYRLVATTEEEFLTFIKSWASWLQKFPADSCLYSAMAAE